MSNKYEDYVNQFEGEEINTDDLKNTDVKINPSFYQHINLIKAQESLVSEDIAGGMLQYFVNAEHMETLCKASNMLPDDYNDELKQAYNKAGVKEKVDKDDIVDLSRRAKIKYQVLLSSIFSKVERKARVKLRTKDL